MANVRSFNQSPVHDPQVAALKLPPHSIEAEQSLIGGLLIDNPAWDRIADVVRENDFYRDDHKRIFRHIGKLIQRGRPADVVTVYESIEQSNEIDQTGGLAYLAEIANATPSAANVRRYAEIVRERAILRQLVTVGDEIAGQALNPAGRDVKQLLDDAERKILQIAETGNRDSNGFVADPALARRSRRAHGNPAGARQPVGHHWRANGVRRSRSHDIGLAAGDMIVVAGRPSMGKTAFALNIAEHVGVELRQPVAIFSLEMSGPQLATRFLSSVGRIDQSKLRTGRLTDDEWDRMTVALGKLHEAPIHIDETGAINSTDLRARARRCTGSSASSA
jgi:replicative DNA helicase